MFLPVERALREEPRYSARQVAEKSGLDLDLLTRQWQALGLAVIDPDDVAYGERDLEAAKRIKQFLDAGVAAEGVIDMARVLGQSLSRVAEASRFLIGQSFLGPESTEYDVAQQARLARPLADLMEETLAYVFGLQLVDQLRHEVADRHGPRRGTAPRSRSASPTSSAGPSCRRRPRRAEIGTVADRLGVAGHRPASPARARGEDDRRRGDVRVAGGRAAARPGARPGGRRGGGRRVSAAARRARVGSGDRAAGATGTGGR